MLAVCFFFNFSQIFDEQVFNGGLLFTCPQWWGGLSIKYLFGTFVSITGLRIFKTE